MDNFSSGNRKKRANDKEVNATAVTITESRAEAEAESESEFEPKRIKVDLDVEIPRNKIEVYLSFHCATPEAKLSKQLIELSSRVSLLKENIESHSYLLPGHFLQFYYVT